ncbi:MAG: transposase, partial [Thermomicrobiales bacterium]
MRQAHIGVFVHLIWSTWDRLPFLTIQKRPQVWRAIGAKCVELGAEVIAIGGIEDHVHLLVRLPATLAVADLVK